MPSITINIAAASDNEGSAIATTRAMWFELNDDNASGNSISSYGWLAAASETHDGQELASRTDRSKHAKKSYSRTIALSRSQYQKIRAFATDPLAHGLDPRYDLLNNNSIGFVWLALRAGGLDPADFAGRCWPDPRPAGGNSLPFTVTASEASHWRNTEITALVGELFLQSQQLAADNWKHALLNSLQHHLAASWQSCSSEYDRAHVVRYDPLAIDLDGDGLKTLGIDSQVHFDHDGDGIRTVTGWIAPEDGFLVMDRNHNGIIDHGRELFGDSTPLASGATARNGFAALAAQDTNQDGVVDRNDDDWNRLQIWCDMNQDGVSQKHELFALDQFDIASLELASTRHHRTLGNGNQVAETGHYTRNNGSRGSMADINFREQPFFRRFADAPAISDMMARLPDVAGSGKVRDLRAAATSSAALHETLVRYADTTTRSGQRALLDQLLSDWAASSGMSRRLQDRVGSRYRIEWNTLGPDRVHNDSRGAGLVAAMEKKLWILDAFNGRHFFDVRDGRANPFPGFHVREGWNGHPGTININLSQRQLNTLNDAYAILQDAVYGSLLIQTRFKSMFGQVQARITGNRVQMDFSSIEQYFERALAARHIDGLADLIEFYQYANSSQLPQWRADVMLAQQLHIRDRSPEEQQLFAQNGISSEQRYEWKNNIIIGSIAGEWVFGSYQNDLIYGDAGNDELYGFNNDDLLDGGSGNDYLKGGRGDDIYLLRRHAGHDVIDNADGEILRFGIDPQDMRNKDIVIFEDITLDEVRAIRRDGNDMRLDYGSDDSVTIKNMFVAPATEIHAFHFAGGAPLSTSQLLNAKPLEAQQLGADDDRLHLSRHHETLFAGSGSDTIDGAAGDDILHGESGEDLLFGNAGDDLLDGGTSDDLLIGGSGNDTIFAGSGADVIAFNRGDGFDTIHMSATSDGNTVSLGGGIGYDDLSLTRDGNHLTLNLGAGEAMTFHDWYAGSNDPGVAWLQMLLDGSSDDNSMSASALRGNKVVRFDFSRLVAQFDAARSSGTGPGRWALASALQQADAGSSDMQAFGDERAYQYGRQQRFLMPASVFELLQQEVPAIVFAGTANGALSPS